jgi:hypothetical protein
MPVEPTHGAPPEDNVPPPTGTIFVMGLYLLALIVAWSAMFLMLVEK